jgi:hypothetical protein
VTGDDTVGSADNGRGAATPRGSFPRRLPELLIEATFVFLAVLLALVAEEWRERQDESRLAERATAGIVDELRANRERVLADAEFNREQMENLRAFVRARESGEEPEELSVNYKAALVSSSAWEAARMSQAVLVMDLEVVRDLAQVYELQELFERNQNAFLDGIATGGSRARDDATEAVRGWAGEMAAVMGYRELLGRTYATALELLDAEAQGT